MDFILVVISRHGLGSAGHFLRVSVYKLSKNKKIAIIQNFIKESINFDTCLRYTEYNGVVMEEVTYERIKSSDGMVKSVPF